MHEVPGLAKIRNFIFSKKPMLNCLPYDGVVQYYGMVMPPGCADQHYRALMQFIEWKNDEITMFGKRIITKRKVAWYGDAPFDYVYSGQTKTALPWTTELQALKHIAETHTGAPYNSCLLNLYHDGDEGMSWHSDDEKMLQPEAAIASFSFGAERKFSFKHKTTKESVSLMLAHGSLLLMKGGMQQHWLHALPKSKKVTGARINLTFRSIVD